MFKKLLIESAAILESAGIPYIVIGGQAVLLYGEPRFTRDIDITLGIDTDQLAKVKFAFEKSGFVPRPLDIDRFVRETSVFPLEHTESGIRMDLIFSFSPFEQNAIQRAHFVEIDGFKVAFASIEDLIVLKIFAGRPLDLDDVAKIIMKNSRIDSKYIVEWLQSFEQIIERPLVQTWKNIIEE